MLNPSSPLDLKGFFSELHSHLHEAKQNKTATDTELFPNFSGTSIYSHRSYVGRCYSYFFKTAQLVCSKDCTERRIEQAFVHASVTSDQLLKSYEKSYQVYQQCLLKRCQGQNIDEQKFFQARWKLAEFEATLGSSYRGVRDHPERYQEIFDRIFNAALQREEEAMTQSKQDLGFSSFFKQLYDLYLRLLKCLNSFVKKSASEPPMTSYERTILAGTHCFNAKDFLEKIDVLLPIIQLEKELDYPMPLDVLAKVFLKKKWSKEEDKVLLNWCKKLYVWKHPEAAMYFHLAISAFYQFLDEAGFSPSLSVEHFERQLFTRKGNQVRHLYTTQDPLHLKWVSKHILSGKKIVGLFPSTEIIKPSIELERDRFFTRFTKNMLFQISPIKRVSKKRLISQNTKPLEEITIGKQLHQVLGNRFFHVVNRNFLLRVPQNRCILWVEPQQAGSCLSKSLKVKYIDPQSKFALVEEIAIPLDQLSWDVQGDISKDPKFKALVKQIKGFIQSKRMPEALRASYFVFTKNHEIKAWLPLIISSLDISFLLNYMKQLTNGNRAIYQQLLQASNLQKSVYGNFFQQLLESVLKDQSPDVRILAEINGLNEATRVQGESFVKKVYSIKQQMKQQLSSQEIISQKIKKAYIEKGLIIDIDALDNKD